MTDAISADERSELMSRVRDRDTAPELKLRKALWARGHRYRLQYPLSGRPDLTFVRARVVVFVDGCFWHCCPIHATFPKSNANWWRRKLRRNRERDQEVTRGLISEGWTVLRFWEHHVDGDLPFVIRIIEGVLKDIGPSPPADPAGATPFPGSASIENPSVDRPRQSPSSESGPKGTDSNHGGV